MDEQGAAVTSGVLDDGGKSTTVELKPGKVKIIAQESQDDYVVTPIRRANPHYAESTADDVFFDIASKGGRGFWQPTRIDTLGTPWGSIGQSLSEDKFFQDIVGAEVKLHFTHFHPESAYDFSKTCDVIVGHLNQPLPHTTEALLAYTLPIALEEGELLSVLLRLAPHENTDRMLAYMRARGTGNPQAYLSNYDWQAAKKTINDAFESLFDKIKSRLTFLRDEANKLQYAYLSQDVFDKHINTLNTYMKGLPELISGTFTKLQTKASLLLANTTNVHVIKAPEDLHATENRTIPAVVNTTQSVDTVEPYMNEVAGVIENVIPIYPVRYGYANFFDELMPAQAPPSMLEISGASGLKDTGGYLLRLLREGWLYIKEESEEDTAPFHIFKYAQTQTPTGVIEKFEKYYFTNEENAQEGLTLDTSSGSTFYPFAFVTPKAKKISIVYSEHEWSAAIIDNMNNDEELRKKAMQQVDLSSTQTEFSQEATQDNLNALVEDYRSNEDKWLAIESSTPKKHGLDMMTTHPSYHLSSEGVVESMKKSHSVHKEGVLVTLFDPVGRQADLAYALTVMTGYQKMREPETVYPRTIGDIVKGFLNHPNSDIQSIAKENLDEASLDSFFQDLKVEDREYEKRREALLDLYSMFAYKDMADGSIGSLDNYLKMYFDIESDTLKEPEKEVEKLTLIAASIFDGNGATEEGQAALIDMINHAYDSESTVQDSQNAYYIITHSIKNTLLQCQDQFDWQRVIAHTPVTLSQVWAQ
ncbi:toxin VasX, partial [Vibrio lentus]